MSRSRRKEKYGNGSELSKDDYNEETAARTRPLSFDEIMRSRKNKKFSGDVKGAIDVGNKSGEVIVDHVSRRFEPDRGYRYNKDYVPGVVKHVAEDISKGIPRKKEDKTSMKEDILVRGKDKPSHGLETKLKAKLGKDRSSKAKDGKIEERGHGRRRDDIQERYDSENEVERKHLRNSSGKEIYANSSREKFDRDSKRKDRNGDDENNRPSNTRKKHAFGRSQNVEYSERKERMGLPQSRYEESRAKRRRSRSREHEKDRDRRSNSISPKAHKRTSRWEHGELSSNPISDRSGRKHFDVESTRPTINGSSSHYRRHGGSTSRLGGYSPRKRKSEAAVKTPSPTNRSPEKKNATWDLPPVGKDNPFSGSLLPNLQSSKDTVSPYVPELASTFLANTSVNSVSGVSALASSIRNSASIDSIQLTQATRPARRLYVENLPASASEKEVMESINSFLRSSGVNHIQGTQPCISCIIHKEKAQALLEFLTPEDSSMALSFDGNSISGSIVKIRRPKDFVNVATGVPERSTAAVDAISNIVKDSPHKIFIGGISRELSSKMIMDIASAFGTLKAYHFQVNEDLNEPCAFLEYVDPSVTPKACAGLNGMKLGGKVLTTLQATPDVPILENSGNSPFYGIPENAKPLLEKPTHVLKLKNVFDPEGVILLSEAELEELLEDVRLECARFGIVKSVNIVKDNCSSTDPDACEATDHIEPSGALQNLECDDMNTKMENLEEGTGFEAEENSRKEFRGNVGALMHGENAEDFDLNDDKPANNSLGVEHCERHDIDSNVDAKESFLDEVEEFSNSMDRSKIESEFYDGKSADVRLKESNIENNLIAEKELNSLESKVKLEEGFTGPDGTVRINSDSPEEGDNKEQACNLEQIFEPGCVLVEYGRTESSCIAAHSLHGRLFDDRTISVQFVAIELYRKKFPE